MERKEGSARTTQLVSLVLHRKDSDVYVLQGLRASTVKKVVMLALSLTYPSAHVNFDSNFLNFKHSTVKISIFACANQH